MSSASFVRGENQPGADREGRQHGRQVNLDRQRRGGEWGEVHFAASPRCLVKNVTIEALKSRWKAARSKPGGSRQISGARSTRASLHGARKAKWPACGTTCTSGGAGRFA